MELLPTVQWLAFSIFALIAVAGALGMATTMSMFRSGIFLMASFIGVAGLFLLLMADLLALLQVMMYIGGMLVMILFMVLFSHDPGGEMMTGMMELPLIEKFFSLGLAHGEHEQEEQESEGHSGGEADGGHRDAGDEGGKDDGEEEGGNDHDEGGSMDMQQMSMTTPIKQYAGWLGLAVGVWLVVLLVLRPAWPVTNAMPDQRSALQIGNLLMTKYMIAFEGAGMMILLGIFGAVFLARPIEHPDSADREHLQAAVEAQPAPGEAEPLKPEYEDVAHRLEDEQQQEHAS